MHAVVAGWLTATGPSGANRRLAGMLNAMAPLLADGERVTLLCGRDDPAPSVDPRIRCVAVDIPAQPLSRRWWRQSRVLPGLLRESGATVFEQGFLPIGGKLPCPLSLTLHDFRDLSEFARRSSLVARTGIRHGLRRAAAVTVPSEFTRRELVGEFARAIPERVAVIPNGVDDRFFSEPPSNPVAQPLAEPYFLHVGHLEARKNLELLRRVWAVLGDDAPRLVFAGVGPRPKGFSERVEFVGRVSDEELLALYAECRALLFPSLYEGFGLPALEALAAGRPVLVSDAGALPEVVGAAGTVLPGNDVSAWVHAIGTDDSTATGDSTARRARAREFSWHRCAEQTIDLWRELSAQEPASPATSDRAPPPRGFCRGAGAIPS